MTTKTMKAALLGCGLLAGMMSTVTKAIESETAAQPTPRTSMHLRVYGTTLPPIGHVEFCKSHKSQCTATGVTTREVSMTNERWAELSRVNDYVNRTIEPVTDQDLYQVSELWTYPDTKGDCEDYVLLKKHYLTEMGWPTETLLITVVLDQQGAGHAVLTVRTDLGDFVLDNQIPAVLPWQDTPYHYIKRQSQEHPSVWVSLDPTASKPHSTTSGRLNSER